MSRELWSQSGEPTWAIDERLRRLEVRVSQLADVVADLAQAVRARDRDAGGGEPAESGLPAGSAGSHSPPFITPT